MRDPDRGWEPPPRRTMQGGLPQAVSLWEPPPRQQASGPERPAGEAPAPRPPKPPWYRRAWFVSLLVVAVFGTVGAVLGSQSP
jgi:hypothetical protein